MGTVLLFILVLSLLVFVHELGHFVMARRMGMKVEEFGFGFPPRLWSVRRGETDYSINWIPLGGFVKIKGESGDQADDSDSFAAKKPWQRFLVLIAGVAMNILLAAFLFGIGYMSGLPSIIDSTLSSSARVSDQAVTVMQVVEGSVADQAGIIPGDEIVSIDGNEILLDVEVRDYFELHAIDGVEVEVRTIGDEVNTLSLQSEYLEELDREGLGIGFVSTGLVSYPFFQAIGQGVQTTGIYTWEILKAFGALLRDLVVTQEVSVDLSGPVGIAVMTGEVAARGLIYLLQFTAILSINLAIINILPFPALDGGRILFLAIEKLRGRPVNEKIEIAAHNAGFALLMALVIFVTFKDFATFGDQILNAIKSMI
jgi:regulator of sigma E protease